MSFTKDDVNKLAYLARLATDHSIVEDLNKILQLVSKISEINTDNIEPMGHAQEVSQRYRLDVVTEPNVRELMQSCIPDDAKAAGLYLVPKVVDSEG
jgi:aspartyl-tRNA(Asn)/glutamyl-tRNA(Gln) amidotransferase subunit C